MQRIYLILMTLFFTSAPAWSAAPNVSWWRGEDNATDSVGGNHGSTVNWNGTSRKIAL